VCVCVVVRAYYRCETTSNTTRTSAEWPARYTTARQCVSHLGTAQYVCLYTCVQNYINDYYYRYYGSIGREGCETVIKTQSCNDIRMIYMSTVARRTWLGSDRQHICHRPLQKRTLDGSDARGTRPVYR